MTNKEDINKQLIRSIRYDDLNDLKDALASGADFNNRDEDGWTPLMLAIYNDKVNCLKKLIEMGADLNIQDNFGNSALIHVSSDDMIDSFIVLIYAGADTSLKNIRGHDFITISYNRIRAWLCTEEGQEMILSRSPIMISSFKKSNIDLHPNIKFKYSDVISADELGIL